MFVLGDICISVHNLGVTSERRQHTVGRRQFVKNVRADASVYIRVELDVKRTTNPPNGKRMNRKQQDMYFYIQLIYDGCYKSASDQATAWWCCDRYWSAGDQVL